jgi:hypothetical protein
MSESTIYAVRMQQLGRDECGMSLDRSRAEIVAFVSDEAAAAELVSFISANANAAAFADPVRVDDEDLLEALRERIGEGAGSSRRRRPTSS